MKQEVWQECHEKAFAYFGGIPKTILYDNLSWCIFGLQLTIKSGLTCFNRFLGTLDKWMDGITNYFISRQTIGFVEGFNNKIKVIKRRCYEILNVKHLFQRIHLDLKGYSLFA